MQTVDQPAHTVLLAIDALDELPHADGTLGAVLRLLSMHLSRLPTWVRLFVTSRDETAIPPYASQIYEENPDIVHRGARVFKQMEEEKAAAEKVAAEERVSEARERLELASVVAEQLGVIESAADALVDAAGDLEIGVLVNNAGVWFGDVFDLTGGDDQGLMTSLRVNVEAAYLCTKRLLPLLLASDDPRIVNVGSTSGIFGPNLKTAYGVSKAALHALTIATANELYGRAAVNGLSPGWVKTDMAPDAPRHPRWSAEGALSIVTQPAAVTGKLFHGTRMRSWTARFPRA